MTVRWQIVQAVGGIEQGQPKSDAGDRQVSLDKATVKELRAHKVRQNTERLAAGNKWTESGFVFTTPTGGRSSHGRSPTTRRAAAPAGTQAEADLG